MTATAQLYENGKLVCTWAIPDAPPLRLRRYLDTFIARPYIRENDQPVLQTFALTGLIAENVYRYDREA